METYTVTVEPIGAEIECREDQTVLDACLREGIWLPHACTHGTCGTCKAQVLDGELDLGDASPTPSSTASGTRARPCCASRRRAAT
ncbi:2Fe-2S iron-sulfur cluster-binding protein [Pseudonocardia benzenivorans]